jgi:hypothetical protein
MVNALNAISPGVVMPADADPATDDGAGPFEQLLEGTLTEEPIRDADPSGSGELSARVAVALPARLVVAGGDEPRGLLEGLRIVEQSGTDPMPGAIDAPSVQRSGTDPMPGAIHVPSVEQPSLPELPVATGGLDAPDGYPAAASPAPTLATMATPSTVVEPAEPPPSAGGTEEAAIEPTGRFQPERSRSSRPVGEPMGPDRWTDTGASMPLTSGTAATSPSAISAADPSSVSEVRQRTATFDPAGAFPQAVAGEPVLADAIDAPVTTRPGATPPVAAVGAPNPSALSTTPTRLDLTQPAAPAEPVVTDPNVARLSGAVRTIQRGEVRVTTVSLRPAELGHIRVELHDDGGALALRLVPSTPEARDLIRLAEGALRRDLAATGVQLDRIDVDLRGGGGEAGLSRRDVPVPDAEAWAQRVDPPARPTPHPIRSHAASRHHGLEVDL